MVLLSVNIHIYVVHQIILLEVGKCKVQVTKSSRFAALPVLYPENPNSLSSRQAMLGWLVIAHI